MSFVYSASASVSSDSVFSIVSSADSSPWENKYWRNSVVRMTNSTATMNRR